MPDFNMTQLSLSRLLHQLTATVTVGSSSMCESIQCGEALCVSSGTDGYICRCEATLSPPDKKGRCVTVQEMEADNSTGVLHHKTILKIFNFSSTQTNQTEVTSSDDYSHIRNVVQLLYIFLPIMVVMITVTVSVFVWRRRRHRHTVQRRKISPDKRVNVPLLERLGVVVTNVNYLRYDNTDKLVFSHLQEKLVTKERLTIDNMIGQGAFGQVFKGELKDGHTSRTVAVKMLKTGSDHGSRDDFIREAIFMASFDHKNILRLIAIVAEGVGDTPYAVFEYMLHGDLGSLLRKNDPHMREQFEEYTPLSKLDRVKIAVEIADGMDYLASLHFVHRDLAARNVLVGDHLQVKISDFGMSRDIYSTDYYKVGGSKLLPVRWMSFESLKYGKFTPESDIWSFGVVLWEIYTFGKQPYFGYSNEQVVQMLHDGILLQRPPGCSSTVYHVMLACWKLNPRDRMSFSKIRQCLQSYTNHMDEDIVSPY